MGSLCIKAELFKMKYSTRGTNRASHAKKDGVKCAFHNILLLLLSNVHGPDVLQLDQAKSMQVDISIPLLLNCWRGKGSTSYCS